MKKLIIAAIAIILLSVVTITATIMFVNKKDSTIEQTPTTNEETTDLLPPEITEVNPELLDYERIEDTIQGEEEEYILYSDNTTDFFIRENDAIPKYIIDFLHAEGITTGNISSNTGEPELMEDGTMFSSDELLKIKELFPEFNEKYYYTLYDTVKGETTYLLRVNGQVIHCVIDMY